MKNINLFALSFLVITGCGDIATSEPLPVQRKPIMQETPHAISRMPKSSEMITVAGVEMKVYLPKVQEGEESPRRLAIYLHGDTANGYFDEFYHSLREFSTQNGMVFVAALAPNRNSWWHENVFADDFAEALNALKEKYNVAHDQILYSGVSGGSTFLTMQFVPRYGDQFPGTVAAMCGGAPPQTFRYEISSVKDRMKLYYTYGSQDFLATRSGAYGPVIPRSISSYRENGFKVTEKILPQKTHCAFDTSKEILDVWKRELLSR